MKFCFTILSFFLLLIAGCAQVPKESVELSATLGRDIAIIQKAHVQLASLLFTKMKQDVNRFIDEVYAPHQIRAALERQKELANSDDENERKKSLLLGINAAFQPGASDKLQQSVLKGMELLLTKIRNDVEDMRKKLLDPLNQQEQTVLVSINSAYQQMHYANSIVTGHLSSVVKVHEVQADLLSEIGIERDLRKEVGEGISKVSTEITLLVNKAKNVKEDGDTVEKNAQNLQNIIGALGQILKSNNKE